jgi:hypothetical protein
MTPYLIPVGTLLLGLGIGLIVGFHRATAGTSPTGGAYIGHVRL